MRTLDRLREQVRDLQRTIEVLEQEEAAERPELGERTREPDRPRVYLTDEEVRRFGAPSVRWVRERARRGELPIHGARGKRFVYVDDLSSTTGRATIRRASSVPAAEAPALACAVGAAVTDLAQQRARLAARRNAAHRDSDPGSGRAASTQEARKTTSSK